MARVRPLVNEPCHKTPDRPSAPASLAPHLCPWLHRDANVEKSCERAPQSCKLIRISGSALLAIQAIGEYRAELRRAVAAIREISCKAHHHPEERALLRLDGQYGTGAVLADLAGPRLCHAWQRLSALEASRGPGSPETASRSAPDATRKVG